MKKYFCSAIALGLLVVSSVTLADHDNRRGNGRGPPAFVGHNNSRDHDRDYRRDVRPDYRDHRDHDDVNWSVNLNIGARPFGYNPYGYNMLGYRPEPYSYRSRQPVVIYQSNTYIDPVPSGSYVTRRTDRQGVSLLRDSSGRCFERYRDGRGNETRTELPRSSCAF